MFRTFASAAILALTITADQDDPVNRRYWQCPLWVNSGHLALQQF
jgi:hypothetical protein